MNTLRAMTLTCASLLALSTPLLAQDGHEHHGGADASPPAAEASPATPAPPATSGGGMSHGGGKMGHGGMHGKHDCKGMMGGGADASALERRIGELEKRLDLMQLMLQRATP